MSRPLSTEEVAKILEVDVRTIQRWCRSTPQKLAGAYKVSGAWLVPLETVEKYKEDYNDDPS